MNKVEEYLRQFSPHIPGKIATGTTKNFKDIIKLKSAEVIMDFSENYTCITQDQIQSTHWVNQAVTLHPIMVFLNQPEC